MANAVQVRIRESFEELLIEIPNSVADKLPVDETKDLPPFPDVSFGQKMQWRFCRLIHIWALPLQVGVVGFIVGSCVAAILIPSGRVVIVCLLILGLVALLATNQSTFIYLNRTRNFFLVYTAIFPVLPRTFDGRLSKIESVTRITSSWMNPESRVIMRAAIKTDTKSFLFGKGLNQTECDRLIQVILDWLQRQPTDEIQD